jgi:hypothetical protein
MIENSYQIIYKIAKESKDLSDCLEKLSEMNFSIDKDTDQNLHFIIENILKVIHSKNSRAEIFKAFFELSKKLDFHLWQNMVRDGELPALKLDKRSMSLLSGGDFSCKCKVKLGPLSKSSSTTTNYEYCGICGRTCTYCSC